MISVQQFPNTRSPLSKDPYSLEDPQNAPSPSDNSCTAKRSGKWTVEEDDLLREYAPIYDEKHWKKISQMVPGRSAIQCLHRWTKILKPGLVKGAWTTEEDNKLTAWVQKYGATKWSQAAKAIEGRNGKQCRERWFNNLSPEVKKGEWTQEEDELLFDLYQNYGSAWSLIAKSISGRTENAVKNRFYSALRRIAAEKKKIGEVDPKEAGKRQKKPAKQREGKENQQKIDIENENDHEIYMDEESSEDKSTKDLSLPTFEQLTDTSFTNLLKGPKIPPLYPEVMCSRSFDSDDDRISEEKPENFINSVGHSLKPSHFKTSHQNVQRETILIQKTPQSARPQLDRKDSQNFENFLARKGFDFPSPIPSALPGTPSDGRQFENLLNEPSESIHYQSFPSYRQSPNNRFTQQMNASFETNRFSKSPSHVRTEVNLLAQKFDSPELMAGDISTVKIPKRYSTFFEAAKNERQNTIPPLVEYDYNGGHRHNLFEEKPQSSLLGFPRKIIEECSSTEADGIKRITNLISLLNAFASQAEEEEQYISGYGRRGMKFDKKAMKQLVTGMRKAVDSASSVHFGYVRNLLRIVKDLSKISTDEAKNRINFLFDQLSTLDNLLTKVKEQIYKIEASLEEREEQEALQQPKFRAEEIPEFLPVEKEIYMRSPIHGFSPMQSRSPIQGRAPHSSTPIRSRSPLLAKSPMSMRLENFDSDFEKIYKKRLLG